MVGSSIRGVNPRFNLHSSPQDGDLNVSKTRDPVRNHHSTAETTESVYRSSLRYYYPSTGEMTKKITITYGPQSHRPGASAKINKLKEIELTKRQADTFEAVANVSEDEFEKIIAETKNTKKELTTSSLIENARKLQKIKHRQEMAEKGKTIECKIDLRLGDFSKELVNLKNVDLILTDPPFPSEFLDEWEKLSKFAEKILKPSKNLHLKMARFG